MRIFTFSLMCIKSGVGYSAPLCPTVPKPRYSGLTKNQYSVASPCFKPVRRWPVFVLSAASSYYLYCLRLRRLYCLRLAALS
ncbi:Uncharacterised protein [Neisseria meningitidis]|nr:Uncharacterised protein [Neisseria meningitidis]